MIELLKAVLFGIVEGITEWLPVSSTGHMIILDEFIRLDCTPEFLEMFLVVIQLGAIMAVVILFWNKIVPFQFRDRSRPVVETDKIMLVSFFVSVFVIRFLMDYIKRHDFQIFGWYRIVLGAVVIALGACGVITV